MSVRFAIPQDAKAIIEILRIFGPMDPDKRAVEEYIRLANARKETALIVGCYRKKVVGTAMLFCAWKLIHGFSRVGFIEDVAVLPDYQGYGVGREMIRKLVELATSRQCYKCVLFCSGNNIRYYKKCGFRIHQNAMRIDL